MLCAVDLTLNPDASHYRRAIFYATHGCYVSFARGSSSMGGSGFESFVLSLADLKLTSRGENIAKGDFLASYNGNVPLEKCVALTSHGVHEKASSPSNYARLVVTSVNSRDSLTRRLSIGSMSLLYANTASRIAETWAFLLAGLWLSLHIYLASSISLHRGFARYSTG